MDSELIPKVRVERVRFGHKERHLPEAPTKDTCVLFQQSSCLKTGSAPLKKKEKQKNPKKKEALNKTVIKKQKKNQETPS